MIHPVQVNERFGHLVALHPVGSRGKGGKIWLCRCDCGREVLRVAGILRYHEARNQRCTRSNCAVFNRDVEYARSSLRKRFRNRFHAHQTLWTATETRNLQVKIADEMCETFGFVPDETCDLTTNDLVAG